MAASKCLFSPVEFHKSTLLPQKGTFPCPCRTLHLFMDKLQVLPEKYNAELIDRARAQIDEEERIRIAKNQQKRESSLNASRYEYQQSLYGLFSNNCQDYAKKVLDRAKQLETPYNPLIVK